MDKPVIPAEALPPGDEFGRRIFAADAIG